MIERKIAIIGAGKLAYSLTSTLLKAGYNVQSVVSRKLSSAKSLAKKFSIPHHSNSLLKIPDEIDVFFLTVPDGEIKKVADNLSRLKRDFKNCICIHFSGVENIDSLCSLAKNGCATGSLHIMQTFPSKKPVDIVGVSAAIETENNVALKFLKSFAKNLRLKAFLISTEQKALYHLAGVFASNFMSGNLFASEVLLRNFNLKPARSFEVLKSTAHSTLNNVEKSGAAKSLSGPVERGDVEAVKKHISSLKKIVRRNSRDKKLKNYNHLLLISYLFQSLMLLEVVKKKYGKVRRAHLKIRELLMDEIKLQFFF